MTKETLREYAFDGSFYFILAPNSTGQNEQKQKIR